ncbi:MAG: hypothetical protein H7841_05815 [Magnetospirillum sp. WYHS-4]
MANEKGLLAAADKGGLALVAIGGLAALLAVLLPIPVFLPIGIWYQSESMSAFLAVAAGVAALGIALMGLTRAWVRLVLVHPAPLLAFGLAAWSVVAGAFQSLPWAGWYGSPEIGEGVYWYLELGIFVASGMILARTRWLRLALALGATAVIGLVTAATWYNAKDGSFQLIPFFFPDYLAFMGIALIALLAGLLQVGDRSRWLWPILAMGGGVVWVSTNYATIGLFLVMAPASVLLAPRVLATVAGARRGFAIFAILVPLAVSVTVSLPFLEPLSTQQNFVGRLANSALSRHYLSNVVVTASQADPAMALHGFGWGRYSDLLAIHLPVEWAVLNDTLENRYEWRHKLWDAVHRVDFHSHNYLLDAFIGGGLPAVILALLLTASIPFWARRKHLHLAGFFAVVLGGTAAYWFQLAGTMPYVALAMAAIASPRPRLIPFRMRIPVVPAALLLALGLFLGFTGARNILFAGHAFSFMPTMSLPLSAGSSGAACPDVFDDGGRGGLHLMHRLRTVASAAVGAVKKGQNLSEDVVQGLRGLACAAEAHVERGTSFRLLVATLLARADLAFAPPHPLLDRLTAEYLVNWETRLTQALRIAPRRHDLAAPYLLWLLKENRAGEFAAWANLLFERNPNDKVAIWFAGIALLEDPARAEEGLRRMRQAMEMGIERVIPVDPSIKEELLR